MAKPLSGVRVLEVAAWTFVPAAGAILADLGAEVIKVEPPSGDPQRGLLNMLNLAGGGPNPFHEIPNRGKRSITLDLRNESGREALLALARISDVFLTSYLPALRERLRIDVADLRAVNERIIYVRGSGWGAEGPMRNTGGYDLASAWASSGMAHHLMRDRDGPAPMPAAFFDLQGANAIAGAIGMALFQRERTGEASVVDVSLLNVGMWTMAPGIVSAPYVGATPFKLSRREPPNPITNWYETKDGRWIYLVLLQADRFWPELCPILGRPDLVDDPRFRDAGARFANRAACVAELDAIFSEQTLEEWKQRLQALSGVWAPALTYLEIVEHPQVAANGFLPAVTGHDGRSFRLVAPPMHFDEVPTAPAGPAPELGQDTEALLAEAGLDWDAIAALRARGGLG
ncbi:MAG TPA: CoA transferase [Myxococcota bacterium]|nr:CoA transferase [Myxococcota bacterium]